MELNKKGWELFDKWESKYWNELERLQKEKNNPNYYEGWCIIENDNFVKTPEDLVGLYLFGYCDHIFDIIDEWKETLELSGSDNVWDYIDMTFDELEEEMEKYFD